LASLVVLGLHDLELLYNAFLEERGSHHHDLVDVNVLLTPIESGIVFRGAFTVV